MRTLLRPALTSGLAALVLFACTLSFESARAFADELDEETERTMLSSVCVEFEELASVRTINCDEIGESLYDTLKANDDLLEGVLAKTAHDSTYLSEEMANCSASLSMINVLLGTCEDNKKVEKARTKYQSISDKSESYDLEDFIAMRAPSDTTEDAPKGYKLTKDDIKDALKDAKSDFNSCDESADVAGKLKVSWVIKTNGKVMEIEVLSKDFEDSNVAECYTKIIARMKFPKNHDGGKTVKMTFSIP